MDANNLIAYNAVNRLDDISMEGLSFPTRYTSRNFGSFCLPLTCERCLLSQGVDFFTPTSYPWDASPAFGGRIVWRTSSFSTVGDCLANRSLTKAGT